MTYRDKAVLILFIIWGFGELTVMVFSRKNENKKRNEISRILPAVWLSLAAGIIISISARIFKIKFLYGTDPIFQYIGMVFVLTGMTARWTSFFTLKNYFTGEVVIQNDHKLIEYGIYRYIRHPAYSGAIVSFIGLGFCCANWLSFLIIFIPYTLLILNKIKYEERVLEKYFGSKYINYKKRTKKIIPFVY